MLPVTAAKILAPAENEYGISGVSEFAAAVSATEAETVAPEAADKAEGALVRNGANMRNRAAAIPARTTIPAAALYAAGIKGRVDGV